MRHLFASIALFIGVFLYIGGIVSNVLILDTSQKHSDKMCKLGTVYCWDWFVVVWKLGIAASVLGLVHTLATSFLFARKKYQQLSKFLFIASVIVAILWLATIILGWVENSGVTIVKGYMGIPIYKETPNYGGSSSRNTGITMYTLTANWYPFNKSQRPNGAQGQYRFVMYFIAAMAPAMGKEKFFADDIREYTHANQGLAALVFNHMILAYALITVFIQFHQVVVFRKKPDPISKEATPRHSSV